MGIIGPLFAHPGRFRLFGFGLAGRLPANHGHGKSAGQCAETSAPASVGGILRAFIHNPKPSFSRILPANMFLQSNLIEGRERTSSPYVLPKQKR